MKVEKHTTPTGQWGLSAVAEEYDGTPPLPIVQFDRQPRTLSPDRVALASYLFFGPWMSGRFSSPQWHSPALSQALVDDARPAWLQTEPIHLYATALPKGRRSVSVSMEGVNFGQETPPESQGKPGLVFARGDQSAGARLSSNSMTLATNAWILAANQSMERQFRVVAGCALLFAEDVDADEVIVAADRKHVNVSAMQHLLATARLGLRVTS